MTKRTGYSFLPFVLLALFLLIGVNGCVKERLTCEGLIKQKVEPGGVNSATKGCYIRWHGSERRSGHAAAGMLSAKNIRRDNGSRCDYKRYQYARVDRYYRPHENLHR